ncbi:saccharopine dehydrogenase NADP-binding domain-containing protein [Erythrobacter sp. JK5]|uniref:saccharopine dehydrogenase NADP-binding domain-containing protein n=1 Tax=Erythrobacter sp. JK5 TaxID=2829500 RepID=UPI001BAE4BF1|nr:saccharopine dehydrogenase NADP-binding domain-containing protein [Erythrobacter sp. JK5]QUL38407.1 saccharopine dehydrogenase NADP-binding domain-containing protein [Erythrobacter sp. JK5]
MHERQLEVLILGASGVFGSRLAELASREAGIGLTLAARNRDRLERIADALAPRPRCVALDRDRLTALDLAGYDLVIDAAGPFQASHSRVIESALAAGVDYLDLADGRAFVRDFPRFDEVAKGAGVALTTGASSIPALSHAVIDECTAGWQHIDHLRIGIYPGNRAPRGLSVVEAILSYVGKPVRVMRDGRWQDMSGWGMTHREDIPGLGKRWASVCDTPEQDLLVDRYAPREGAEFFAGLELSILHLGLALLSLPVRWGWVASLRPIARPMLAVAKWFIPFGSDRGAMTVCARGTDAVGDVVTRRWVLGADANRGPYVPVLAAVAMIRRYRDGMRPPPGARACSGMLKLADFAHDFARLGMTHEVFDDAGRAIGFDSQERSRQSCAA